VKALGKFYILGSSTHRALFERQRYVRKGRLGAAQSLESIPRFKAHSFLQLPPLSYAANNHLGSRSLLLFSVFFSPTCLYFDCILCQQV
jgi:hypothetical protein